MVRDWDLMVDWDLSGAMNMALDEMLMQEVRAGRSRPVLRFYTWKPACLTLGFFQKAEQEIDFAACRRQGVDVVRRTTGGRAVLHDEELTYSIIVPEDDALVPRTVTDSYLLFARALLSGLVSLGVPAELSGTCTLRTRDFRSSACFEAPSSYELVVDGRKIVGSAQTRRDGVLLQHGSIVNRLDADKLFSLFRVRDESRRARMKEFLLQKATSIEASIGRVIAPGEMTGAFADGFERELGVRLSPRDRSDAETDEAVRLVRTRYAHDDWTRRK